MNDKNQGNNFVKFCKNNKLSIWVVMLILFLTYGFMLLHFSFSIDTEDIIEKQLVFYEGWLGINRYGLVFTKWVFGILSIIPGYTTILMVLATLGYSLAWMYFWNWIKGAGCEKTKYGWLFPVLFLSSVPVLELVNFQCLSFEVAFAMLICSIALLCEWRWILNSGGKADLIAAVLLGVWCFASYQAFVPLFISASLAAFLIQYQNNEEVKEKSYIVSLKLLGVFLINYLVYNVLGSVIRSISGVDAGTYTENMIQWGKLPVRTICIMLKDYILDVLLARNIFYNWGYFFVVITLLGISFWKIREKVNSQKRYWYYILVLLVFLGSPFLLPFLMGIAPVVRGQLALPFVIAIGVEIAIEKFDERFGQKEIIQIGILGLLLVLIIRTNVMKDNRLLYSEYAVKQQENTLTEKIVCEIEKVGGSKESTVVVLGNWRATYNPSMIRGETLGWSFYEWDANIPGETGRRVINYWNSLGYRYMKPTAEQISEAQKVEMPPWPQEGSVVKEGDLVIVKLSE